MKKAYKLIATLKGRAKMDKKINKNPDAMSYTLQEGILMSQNEFQTLLDYHESLYGEIFLLNAQIEAFKQSNEFRPVNIPSIDFNRI